MIREACALLAGCNLPQAHGRWNPTPWPAALRNGGQRFAVWGKGEGLDVILQTTELEAFPAARDLPQVDEVRFCLRLSAAGFEHHVPVRVPIPCRDQFSVRGPGNAADRVARAEYASGAPPRGRVAHLNSSSNSGFDRHIADCQRFPIRRENG